MPGAVRGARVSAEQAQFPRQRLRVVPAAGAVLREPRVAGVHHGAGGRPAALQRTPGPAAALGPGGHHGYR